MDSRRCRRVCIIALALVACGEDPLPLEPLTEAELLLLTQSADLDWIPLNQYRGAVRIDEAGCMRLELAAPNDATVVWPSGTTVWARGDERVIQNEHGRELLDVGEPGRFRGDFAAALDELTDLTSEERAAVRERCPGVYWLVTEGTVRREPR